MNRHGGGGIPPSVPRGHLIGTINQALVLVPKAPKKVFEVKKRSKK